MKRMALLAIQLVAFTGFATAAGAATLAISTNKLTYLVSETINVTVSGNSQGAKDSQIFGQLLYSAALTDTVTSAQTSHTTGGLGTWVPLPLSRGDGFAELFDQTRLGAATVDQLQIASLVLTATGLGAVNLNWSTAGPALDFFGLTNAPGATFTIVVPEPGTALLVGLGLFLLATGDGSGRADSARAAATRPKRRGSSAVPEADPRFPSPPGR